MGDFFHNRSTISVNTLFIASQFLSKFKDKNLHMILGNHDLYYSNNFEVSGINLFSSYPNITVYTKPTVVHTEWQDLLFSGWGYNPLKYDADTLFTHSEINVFAVNQTMPACNSGLKASELCSKFKNVFSGHFHCRQEKNYPKSRIIYTGNPFQMDYGDEGVVKGFDIYNLETKEVIFIENNISPNFIRMRLSEMMTTPVEELKSKIFNSYFKVIIDENITLGDVNELMALINNDNPKEAFIEWENNLDFSQEIGELSLGGFDLKESMQEYINLLDIPNKEEISSYLFNLYNICSENK